MNEIEETANDHTESENNLDTNSQETKGSRSLDRAKSNSIRFNLEETLNETIPPKKTVQITQSSRPKRDGSQRDFKSRLSNSHLTINIQDDEIKPHVGDDIGKEELTVMKQYDVYTSLKPVNLKQARRSSLPITFSQRKDENRSYDEEMQNYSNPAYNRETSFDVEDDHMTSVTHIPINNSLNKNDVIDLIKQNHEQLLLKKQDKNGENDVEIEKKLKKLIDEWYEFCEKSSVLHGMAKSHYKKMGNIISLSAIGLSTLGGTASLGSSGETTGNKQAFAIILGTTSLISGALMTVHRYFNFNQVEKDHSFYSSEFAKLKNEMHMQMYIHQCSSKTYVNLVEFCKAIKSSLDSMIDRAPGIPSVIVKHYEEQKKKNKTSSKYFPSLLIFNRTNQ